MNSTSPIESGWNYAGMLGMNIISQIQIKQQAVYANDFVQWHKTLFELFTICQNKLRNRAELEIELRELEKQISALNDPRMRRSDASLLHGAVVDRLRNVDLKLMSAMEPLFWPKKKLIEGLRGAAQRLEVPYED